MKKMKKMKKIYLILITGILISSFSCENALDLEVINKNEPTLETLKTESGIMGAAIGIHWPDNYWRLWWTVQGFHEIMGDNTYTPWGNYSWRWAQQNTWIELSNGTRILGGSQANSLRSFNTRAYDWYNPFKAEWQIMYFINNQANLILSKLDEVDFISDAEIKKNTLKAWCLWNKGYAYSRIGSIYSKGLIINKYNSPKPSYSNHNEIITEANRLFDEAIAILNSLSNTETYTSTLKNCVSSKFHSGGIPTPEEWIRSINSYKARNLLVNKRVANMTTNDWNIIKTLATNGIRQNDSFFFISDDPDLVGHSTMAAAFLHGWMFVSERLIQDFKTGDNRLARNFEKGTPSINIRSRGIHFGGEWSVKANSDYASLDFGAIEYAVGVSYEENELMLAEAKIRTGDINDGLTHINTVRDFQNSQLTHVSGLLEAEALEELRKERRIGLFTRGLAFYDARRWGVIDDVSAGGGRTNCVVWTAAGVKDSNATFNYNYLSYWDVPTTETDFDTPSSSSSLKEEQPL